MRLRVPTTAIIAVLAISSLSVRVSAQAADSSAVREAAYAASIASIADSAIHRLDLLPARAQLRAQMIFLSPSDSSVAIFAELSRRSVAAAQRVDEISERFERIRVPDDLHGLHVAMVTSLRNARSALDRLASVSNACALDPSAVGRCQVPFSSASSALAAAYRGYLDVRGRIANQIADTRTSLPAFVASRAP